MSTTLTDWDEPVTLTLENSRTFEVAYNARSYSTPPMRAITGIQFNDGTIVLFGQQFTMKDGEIKVVQ